MVGHILPVEEKGRRPWLERAEVLGQGVLRACVPLPPGTRERAVRRRVDQAAWLLRDSGVCRVLTPPDFPWWSILKEEGLMGVDPEPLVQAMAAPLVLADLARRGAAPGCATVALRGGRVSRAMLRAAEELCPHVRALVVTAADGENLRAYLRREYGVPVVEDGPGITADAQAHFSPGFVREHSLELYGPGLALWGLEIWPAGEAVPPGFDPLPFFAFLWEAGQLPVSHLTVISKKLT